MDIKSIKLMSLRGKGYESIIGDLNLYVQDLIDRNNRLNDTLIKFNKDEEIQKLKGEVSNLLMNSIHIMSDKEKELSKNFSNKHYSSCKSNSEYIIYGTGIGTIVKTRCKKCGDMEDITDTNNW